MNAVHLFHRTEWQGAERIKSLRQVCGQIVVAIDRTLQSVFNSNEGSLIPATVRTVVNQPRLDQCRSRD